MSRLRLHDEMVRLSTLKKVLTIKGIPVKTEREIALAEALFKSLDLLQGATAQLERSLELLRTLKEVTDVMHAE